jgi:hypothetical protein
MRPYEQCVVVLLSAIVIILVVGFYAAVHAYQGLQKKVDRVHNVTSDVADSAGGVVDIGHKILRAFGLRD